MHDIGLVAAGFGLGVALGVLPGPVQMLLLTESLRGGTGRGFAAMLGANGTFGLLIFALAAGLSFHPPGGPALRAIEGAGGAFLLWLAWDAMRSTARIESAGAARRGPAPAVRGVLAVLLNPAVWIFLATTASAVVLDAARTGGRPLALVIAAAMIVGLMAMDGTMVLLGGGGRRLGARIARMATPVFAVGLGIFGVLLLVRALTP